uniref:Orn/DAP/Arg decarboxylase 2 N-terminal domain-containing protein n=1 Tax=Tetradesmus obliquus TaxID=3088 RepID=A0A383V9D0_TETOB|eukprot:jgi/Sobl393_1/6123/SZX61550.1
MFSKGTHWLIEGLLHRDHKAAAGQQGQLAAGTAAGAPASDCRSDKQEQATVPPCEPPSSPFGSATEQQSKDTGADEEPLTGREDEAEAAANNNTSQALQQSPSMVKTQLQLGRQSFNRTAPNIFELSRNSSLLDSLQEALPSPQHCSSGSLLFSPRLPAAQMAQLDSLSAAAALTRSISLRHTPTLAQLPVGVQDVLESCGALFIEDGNIEGLAEAASHFIAESGITETFYIYDLGEVARLHNTWRAAMPRVVPHYAGAARKMMYAVAHGVQRTTFDTPPELHKIAALNPRFKCVLRIRCDDLTSKCPLGAKHGADMPEVPGLLQLAQELGLQVTGVSFHVGSGCRDVSVYTEAINRARSVLDMAQQQYGFPPLTLLDIGGGFTAPCDENSSRLFRETAATINKALEQYFPAGCGVDVISEPGRFFAETSATLFTTVLGQRQGRSDAAEPVTEYMLSDSSLGSFRAQVVIDGLEPSYVLLRSPLLASVTQQQGEQQQQRQQQQQQQQQEAAPSGTLNGSSAEPFEQLHACKLLGISGEDDDLIHARAQLPLLRDGDWLMFPYAGAYTISCASMGSFVQPARLFIFSSQAVKGWGDVLPQAAVVSIPETIPEGAEVPSAGSAALLSPLSLGSRGSLGLESAGSGGMQMQRSGSLQRSLVRVPSKPRR